MTSQGQSIDHLLQTLQIELRDLAANKLKNERLGHTLQTTALVNEAYMKLHGERQKNGWQSRSHFLRAAAEAMRRILVDHARARLTQKRGGGAVQVSSLDMAVELPLNPAELLNVHDCLDRFAEEAPIQAELIKLRIFGGLQQKEAAEALDLSRATADRYWAFAKVRLMAMMANDSN